MLETSRLCLTLFGLLASACVATPPVVATPVAPAPPVVSITPEQRERALAEEAKAMLAQAETDVQRARAKRALWLKAWEDLLAARQALARDPASAIRHARSASELAHLGLEQLGYPAVQ
jgi:hypothetical protein